MDNVDYEGATILHFASAHGYIELTRYLLSQGTAKINADPIETGITACIDPLMYRELIHLKTAFVFLPIKGVSVNIQDRDGWTPLHAATCWMQPEVL